MSSINTPRKDTIDMLNFNRKKINVICVNKSFCSSPIHFDLLPFKSLKRFMNEVNDDLIDSLLKNGYTVFDETNCRLHPKKEIDLAKEIAKSIRNVVILTHSPYFLNALEMFTSKDSIEVDWYVQQEDGSVKSTKHTEELYLPLWEPLQTLEDLEFGDK